MSAAFAYRLKGSDSDSSDSDTEWNWKRLTKNDGDEEEEKNLEKIPILPLVETIPTQPAIPSNKRKRNTIWTEVLEDQMMSDSLNYCGIKNKPKNFGARGEESYDYTLNKRYKYNDESSNDGSLKSHKKFKNDHYVKVDETEKEAAKKIIKVLGEPKQYLIYRTVKYLGIEKAMEFLKKTEEIEDDGGMMTINKERRRTPGGIFFHLLRIDKDIEKAVVDKIFDGEMNSFERKKKFDAMREMKKKRKKKHSNGKKNNKRDDMECEITASEVNQNGNGNGIEHVEEKLEHMEEDNTNVEISSVVEDKIDNSKEQTSDLEEGEVE